jgi:hypothetical protein
VGRVVHCKRESYDVYIGRPSVWGNPFEIGKDGTREEVIAKYREHLLSSPDLMARLPELEGKTLGCSASGGRTLVQGRVGTPIPRPPGAIPLGRGPLLLAFWRPSALLPSHVGRGTLAF